VQPLKVMSAPGTGGKVQALGFGHCEGQKESIKERIGTVRNRDSEAIVIDVPLCKGDTGGAVVDGADGDVIGIISHRDDPEGSPLRTTTIARLDTGEARDLLAQAKQLADGTDATKLPGVVCQAAAVAHQ
jgi:S1-C subfamily serine protease